MARALFLRRCCWLYCFLAFVAIFFIIDIFAIFSLPLIALFFSSFHISSFRHWCFFFFAITIFDIFAIIAIIFITPYFRLSYFAIISFIAAAISPLLLPCFLHFAATPLLIFSILRRYDIIFFIIIFIFAAAFRHYWDYAASLFSLMAMPLIFFQSHWLRHCRFLSYYLRHIIFAISLSPPLFRLATLFIGFLLHYTPLIFTSHQLFHSRFSFISFFIFAFSPLFSMIFYCHFHYWYFLWFSFSFHILPFFFAISLLFAAITIFHCLLRLFFGWCFRHFFILRHWGFSFMIFTPWPRPFSPCRFHLPLFLLSAIFASWCYISHTPFRWIYALRSPFHIFAFRRFHFRRHFIFLFIIFAAHFHFHCFSAFRFPFFIFFIELIMLLTPLLIRTCHFASHYFSLFHHCCSPLLSPLLFTPLRHYFITPLTLRRRLLTLFSWAAMPMTLLIISFWLFSAIFRWLILCHCFRHWFSLRAFHYFADIAAFAICHIIIFFFFFW